MADGDIKAGADLSGGFQGAKVPVDPDHLRRLTGPDRPFPSIDKSGPTR